MRNETPVGSARKPYNWRVLAVLVAAIPVTIVLLTPYSLLLQGQSLTFSPSLLISWVAGTIQIGIMAAIGLAIAGRIGLGLPFLESWLAGKPDWLRARKFVLPAILSGAFVGIAIVGLDLMVFAPRLPELTQLGVKNPPAWAGFLASFYGGISEEIQLRLLMLSLFAWIGRFANRTPEGRPGLGVLWVATILAALLFGLLHLQATAAAGLPLTALVITRAVLLNGLGGLVFGWLYWTFGLEAAILSHFSADIVFHVIVPLLAGR